MRIKTQRPARKPWKEIENSTTKDSPFYENEYILCTVNRPPDSFLDYEPALR